MKNNYIICFLFCILYLFPSITGVVYYNDDIFRSVYGYYGWENDGRPLADYIYKSLTLNNTNIPDMYPLLLIVAIGVYCYICIKVGQSILGKRNLITDLICCSFILSPLFASNLWFRYDSFFMVLSVTAALFPFSIIGNIKKKIFFSILSLIICCTLYQPSLSLFICLSSIEMMFLTLRNEKSIKYILLNLLGRIVSIAFSLAIYLKIIIPNTLAGYYFSNYNKVIDFSYTGFTILINNYKSAYSIFNKVYESPFSIPFLAILFFSILAIINLILTSKNKINLTISIFICCISVIIFIPGLGVLSENMPIYPRTFISFGVFIFLPLSIIALSTLNNKIKTCLISLTYFFCFLFFYSSTNALKEEYSNKTILSSRIISILDNKGLSDRKIFIVDGTADYSPIFNITSSIYPFLNDMKPNTFWGGYDGGRFMLMRSGLNNIYYDTNETASELIAKTSNEYPVFKSNKFSIFDIEGVIIIKF